MDTGWWSDSCFRQLRGFFKLTTRSIEHKKVTSVDAQLGIGKALFFKIADSKSWTCFRYSGFISEIRLTSAKVSASGSSVPKIIRSALTPSRRQIRCKASREIPEAPYSINGRQHRKCEVYDRNKGISKNSLENGNIPIWIITLKLNWTIKIPADRMIFHLMGIYSHNFHTILDVI